MKTVSIILPVHNAEHWLNECLQSVLQQDFPHHLELSVYNDSSKDESLLIIKRWFLELEKGGIQCVLGQNNADTPKGVGFAKNRAVEQSHGEYLCFLDADDVMMPHRIKKQYEAALNLPRHSLIGSGFVRQPAGSTERFTKWANNITHDQLYKQIYLSHGPSIIMPTWFCHRLVFDAVNGFSEEGKGTPEDLLFFYKHLSVGGELYKVDDVLLMYRYHPSATTFSIHEDTIWRYRVKALQENVLSKWNSFTIWNAGKQGRKLFRSLTIDNQAKVKCFCDVDEKKIAKKYYIYEESKVVPKPRVPIVHFSMATAPLIICVKQDMTGGCFEENLSSLRLQEGVDYFHFN